MPYKRPDSDKLWIRVNGKRRPAGTTDWEAAEALEKQLNADVWKQEQFGQRPVKSFDDLKKRWQEEKRAKKSKRDDDRIVGWWEKHLGGVTDIRRITRESVDAIVQKHRNVSPNEATSENNTANHYVAILAAMMNAAQGEWSWIEGAPKLRRYPILEGKTRWLEVAEWRKLVAELPEHLRWAATFAIATGLRAGKVFSLEWNRISMKERRLTFKGTANKLGNTIPLNALAMGVLAEIKAAPVSHMTRVFFYRKPVAGGTFTVEPLENYGEAFEKALARAGLGTWVENALGNKVLDSDVNWHTFRHTFASWMAQAGVPDPIINRLGGWSTGAKSGKTSERYKHLNVEHLRPYAAVIDRMVAGEQVQLMAIGGS